MQAEEKQLIEDLFQRLKQAETPSNSLDSEANSLIQTLIKQQPESPYFMAQSIIIQEAALKRLTQQVKQLQDEVIQLKKGAEIQLRKGGFLSGLIEKINPSQPVTPVTEKPQQQTPQYQQPTNISGGSSGFLSGALKTAAGVAGGVMIGNMLTNMFNHSTPNEIINIIQDPPDSASNNHSTMNDNFQPTNFDTFDQNTRLTNNDYSNDDYSDDISGDDFI
ncbi:DUF2076 domain-containing protein [Arsenophonus nasoniae]|uniref:DUF2076 domain-containing protein n=1 Tax=Arsenophonus nasoniae TaxID=638 RepID=D2TZY6_9GAMM|nr:DUF2076 domain-containing protein [Arsenophonus nasoniae]WGM08869.1 DUF2076 domain-containing protein [Arsenophonus nasoniae]CBA73464.1 conserved hypothetical protein [Arsenophonus nasoniae]